eukprot:3210055-Rhodomonas_salina.3
MPIPLNTRYGSTGTVRRYGYGTAVLLEHSRSQYRTSRSSIADLSTVHRVVPQPTSVPDIAQQHGLYQYRRLRTMKLRQYQTSHSSMACVSTGHRVAA